MLIPGINPQISLNFHLRHSTTQEVVLPRIPFCFPNEYKNYSHVKLGTGKPRQQKEVKPDHAYAIAKAEELQDELGSDYPTFVKPMPQSLTSLHIPAQFSMEHLPDNGMRMVLVDEEEEEFKVSYRPHSSSLVAGWSEFAIDNELVEGDCLVFQLIKRALFKVYIFRASSYYENEH
ncbi:B3 domain-containing protein Os06g0194400-like [Triticum urartu]|uniref:B3 domain-containing protein Os06g0194400-like n=1 Tax=Triticum urartu TaxID=4572 RepID=UPI002042DEAB|nr:B3 domain-containing protein Os06g0194400-like [Triticum urartu]